MTASAEQPKTRCGSCLRSLERLFESTQNVACKGKAQHAVLGLSVNSLTMSYFHTGIRTIIGAEMFHGPVRDGKEWYHLAMVIRLDLLSSRLTQDDQFAESISA